VRGRAIAEHDVRGQPPVVVINEAYARRYFGDRDPIGERLLVGYYHGDPIFPAYAAEEPAREIVGVVADVREVRPDAAPRRTVYVPVAQVPPSFAREFPSMGALLVRGERPEQLARAMRAAVRQTDPLLVEPTVRPLTELVGDSIARERFNAVLMAIFAGLALALTAIGLYGVLSYSVAQRAQEIGVRVALGAQRGTVLGMVMRHGLLFLGVGLGLGLVGAFALTRFLSGMLFEVAPTDPGILAVVALILVVVGLAASYIPARRATSVDTVIALRAE
jgi:putative ABC transport system permease protein